VVRERAWEREGKGVTGSKSKPIFESVVTSSACACTGLARGVAEHAAAALAPAECDFEAPIELDAAVVRAHAERVEVRIRG